MSRQPDERAESFTLAVSAIPEHVAWVRTFAAAVAAAHAIPPDAVADVRLAVSELASAATIVSPGADLRLDLSRSDDRLLCSLQPCSLDERPDLDIDPWDVVGALFEDARLVDGCATFSVAIPVAP